jgi:Family of unknown function (DUF6492)
MSIAKIDAVLPLTLKDYERSSILRKSLRLFFMDLGKCWVVTPDKQFHEIKSKLKEDNYCVIQESILIPELKFYRAANKIYPKSLPITGGWYVQQLVKMAIAERIETPFYLTLDADVICTRRVEFSDLIQDGRAISRRTTQDLHPKWYNWSERVLGLTRSGLTHGVTPALLSKDAMIELQNYLSQRVSPVCKIFGSLPKNSSILSNLFKSWRSYLIRSLPWTEYALYNTFLEAFNLYEKYHIDMGNYAIYDNSVWQREMFASWDPKKSFDGNRNFFFTVVQSNARISVMEVWEKVGRYLEIDEQTTSERV